MYQLDKLKNIPGLVHGFSDIKDGNMSFDWGESDSVIKNRSTFLSRLGINSADCIITRTRMSHGTEIEIVNSSLKGRGINLSASGDADWSAVAELPVEVASRWRRQALPAGARGVAA